MMRKQKYTRRVLCFERLEDRQCLSSLPLIAPPTTSEVVTQAQSGAAYGQLPLSFEANVGQTDSRVDYLSRGVGYTLFLNSGEAVLSLATGDTNDVVRMRIVGANLNAPSVGLEDQASRSNYLINSDPSQWHTDVANYGRVEYQDVYSGIDLVYYGNQQRLEYDFLVAPGADPDAIGLAFDGVRSMELDAGGNLILHTSGGDLVKDAPVIYQEIDGVRSTIASHYVLGGGQVRFEVGSYDHDLPLVIDPILSYSTYLGGKTGDDGYAIAVDDAGNAYITGDTTSNNFPVKNPLQSRLGSQQEYDVYVAKLNPAGTALVYSTYLGGKGFDQGEGIAVDSAGNAYVTGATRSPNFPTKNAFQASSDGTMAGFVAKLNASGSALLYSTYLGGSGVDYSHAIAVDSAGKVYVTGETSSANFPTKNAVQPIKPSPSDQFHPDAFVAKIDPSLVGAASLVYSTFLDGSNYSLGLGIAVDGLGNALVTGRTGSTDFPTTAGVYQSVLAGGQDAFVTKINADGSALVYSTFLGGSAFDAGYAIALDGAGNAYVTGRTQSSNFLPTGYAAMQPALSGSSDAFVTKLSPDGSALIYSTYLGGGGTENQTSNPRAGGIAVDALGNAYVTGNTNSTNFLTTTNALQTSFGGGQYDAFVVQLNPSGSAFVYSTYLGGNSMEQVFGIALDSSGNAYVTGTTTSANFPTQNPLQPKYGGGSFDAFVAKISVGSALLTALSAPAPSPGTTATPLTMPQVQPLLDEAIHRWLAVGVGTTALHGIDIRIADLGGATLGMASSKTVWLDDDAAGWNWFVDATPGDDSEFTTPGNQGEQNRIDLLSVVMHEMGHLLGLEHNERDDDVMFETLAAGERRLPIDVRDTAILALLADLDDAQGRPKRRGVEVHYS